MAAEQPEAAKEARAKILEGVDFIETEEDAEAVESAVVKIQSTFRGKKIRSKLATGTTNTNTTTNKSSEANSSSKSNDANDIAKQTKVVAESSSSSTAANKEEELNKKVAEMQVNDNREATAAAQKSADRESSSVDGVAVAPEEADRAAAKIQAGFKGYKTRKELAGGAGTGAPGGGSTEVKEKQEEQQQ